VPLCHCAAVDAAQHRAFFMLHLTGTSGRMEGASCFSFLLLRCRRHRAWAMMPWRTLSCLQHCLWKKEARRACAMLLYGRRAQPVLLYDILETHCMIVIIWKRAGGGGYSAWGLCCAGTMVTLSRPRCLFAACAVQIIDACAGARTPALRQAISGGGGRGSRALRYLLCYLRTRCYRTRVELAPRARGGHHNTGQSGRTNAQEAIGRRNNAMTSSLASRMKARCCATSHIATERLARAWLASINRRQNLPLRA